MPAMTDWINAGKCWLGFFNKVTTYDHNALAQPIRA